MFARHERKADRDNTDSTVDFYSFVKTTDRIHGQLSGTLRGIKTIQGIIKILLSFCSITQAITVLKSITIVCEKKNTNL